ncbi:MAG: hypothetical protein WA892_05595 [Ornithinimicrobium sp.]
MSTSKRDGSRQRRERDVHGGIKWGAAFFGWLTAAGAFVLLASLVAGVTALVDSTTSANLQSVLDDPQSAGVVGAVVSAVLLLIAYVCGGYVAGRMARFDGARQGVAVWLWALVIAVAVALLGYFAGDQSTLSNAAGNLPTAVPSVGGSAAISGLIAAAIALLIALVGAVLGGVMGMRFHRKVDHTDLSA